MIIMIAKMMGFTVVAIKDIKTIPNEVNGHPVIAVIKNFVILA